MTIFDLVYPWRPMSVLCTSDLHMDASDFDEEVFKRDFGQAAREGSRIWIIGDLFDGLFYLDPRYAPSGDAMRTSTGTLPDNFVDIAFEYLFENMREYADLIDFLGVGNHEVTMIKHYGTDLIRRLIIELNKIRDSDLQPIVHAGYLAMMTVKFQNGHHTVKDTWWVYHGKGGGAPVTKGMIDINRVITKYIADVYWMGHKHTKISDDGLRYVERRGKNLVDRERSAFYTAGYKGRIALNNYSEGYRRNYGEERHLGLQSQGGRFVDYEPVKDNNGGDVLKRTLRTTSIGKRVLVA